MTREENTASLGGRITNIAKLVGLSASDDAVEASFLVVPPDNARDDGSTDKDDPEGTADDACALRPDGKWKCPPNRRSALLEEIAKANQGNGNHGAVLETLKSAGIRIFVIESRTSPTIREIMDSIHNVISHVTRFDRSRPVFNPRNAQQCLLYRDAQGKFFNLTLAEHTTAAEGTFKALIDTFSGFQAMVALTMLCRSFACATASETILDRFTPSYLGLIIGLVFTEELSLSWLNTAMFVRGLPSISAYAITTKVESDWFRKIAVLCLTLGSVMEGKTRVVLSLVGTSLATLILLANLGARAWGFLGWRPLPYTGSFFDPILSYGAAIVAGIFMPYMGHRQIQAGGKAGMESVIRIAFLVAVVFVISDYDDFQKFLVIGSESCNQDFVNMSVGVWWTVSLLLCLGLVLRVQPASMIPDDNEPVLDENAASPVGFIVPTLPLFQIDPNLAQKGILLFDIKVEFVLGMIMALGIGPGIVYMAYTGADEQVLGLGKE